MMASSPPTIERVLFVANDVRVYGIPPMTSNRGFNAATWTSPTRPTAQEIFRARLRIVESSVDSVISINVLLEDGNTGELFAGAPYTNSAIVQQALDSSRFFAVRVQGEGGMKATLGIGFEDRSPAFDFVLALADARKFLGLSDPAASQSTKSASALEFSKVQDFSLAEGETIHINLGGKGGRQKENEVPISHGSNEAALFSIAPPPPPAAALSKSPDSIPSVDKKTAQDYGFDDGEFGEFQ